MRRSGQSHHQIRSNPGLVTSCGLPMPAATLRHEEVFAKDLRVYDFEIGVSIDLISSFPWLRKINKRTAQNVDSEILAAGAAVPCNR